MKVRAFRIGQRLDIKNMQIQTGFKPALKDPFVLKFSERKYAVLFRYGTVVFWNCLDSDVNEILNTINPYVIEKNSNQDEEIVEVVTTKKKNEISGEKIFLAKVDVPDLALVSVVLSRSVAMDSLENDVNEALKDLNEVITSFAKNGKTNLSVKSLLKKAGLAMRLQHIAVNQMALLDRPSITWDNSVLDKFYDNLAEEYELDDRYEILDDKLQILFRSVEFILGYIEGRRSLVVELVVVLLIFIEIVFFIVELFVL